MMCANYLKISLVALLFAVVQTVSLYAGPYEEYVAKSPLWTAASEVGLSLRVAVLVERATHASIFLIEVVLVLGRFGFDAMGSPMPDNVLVSIFEANLFGSPALVF